MITSLVVLLTTLISGCAQKESSSSAPAESPILVLGIDGLEWNVILPMIRAGRLPEMAKLMEQGSYGLMRTLYPTLSPPIWTTVATGKLPPEHGIIDFIRPQREVGEPQMLCNLDRRTKAFWNIAGEYDKRVAVIGWWMTFPAEPVNGIMVAQTNTTEQLDVGYGRAVWKGRLIKGVPGQIYPPERHDEIMGLLVDFDAQFPQHTRTIFGKFPYPLTALGQRLWETSLWSLRADLAYLTIAETLLRDDPPYDILAVYFGGPDVASHHFWRYTYPDEFTHPPGHEEIANLGHIIEDYYEYIDTVIGRLRALSPEGTRVLLMSDHGMRAFNQTMPFDPHSIPRNVKSGHHLRAEPAVVIAAGQGILKLPGAKSPAALTRDDLPVLCSVLDITPMILALMGIPVGEDMPGLPAFLDPGFRAAHPVETVPTHEEEAWRQAHQAGAVEIPGQEERLEQLRSLGYIQ
ncbi:MAG: alkaline phosphatase family protein [Candidatus Eisenbacteria sp.]|nr:alkaline phosphatase family protein [Candidatus Eisenbacteria bacterium]